MAETEVDIAEAEVLAETAPKYRAKTQGQDEVASRGELGTMGLEAITPAVEEGYVDPTIVQIIYHRFDGRQVIVPAYMTPKLLAQRIPADAPNEFAGKPAWSVTPTDNYVKGQVKCLLHAEQIDTIRNELAEIGLSPGRCRKANIHTPYDLDQHMALKHKREWEAITEHRDKRERQADRDATRAQGEALVKMAEVLAAQNAEPQPVRRGRPPKES